MSVFDPQLYKKAHKHGPGRVIVIPKGDGYSVLWPGKVVTEISEAGPFWEAEAEHQDYLQRYPRGYTCHFPRPGWKLPHRQTAA